MKRKMIRWNDNENIIKLKTLIDKGLRIGQIAKIFKTTGKVISEAIRRHDIDSYKYKIMEWSKTEDDIIKKSVKLNLKTIETMFLLPNRSYASINLRTHQLKLRRIRKIFTWTKKDINKLRKLKNQSKTSKEIALIMGISIHLINYKCYESKIQRKVFWDKKNDKILREMVRNGQSTEKISLFLNKPDHVLLRRIKILRLVPFWKKRQSIIKKFGNKEFFNVISQRISSSKCSAKEKNLEFNITLEYILKLFKKQKGLCCYSGSKMDLLPSNKKRRRNLFVISIDRINSDKGYVKGNVALCCWIYNQMKNDSTHKEFITYCKNIINWDKRK